MNSEIFKTRERERVDYISFQNEPLIIRYLVL